MDENKDDIVYILTNEAMPSYVKIGKATNLERRIKELDTTSVPLPFECFYAATVKDAAFVERRLHEAFDDHRVRSKREFFEVSPERVVAALQLAAIDDVTPSQDYVETEEDKKALEKAKGRRSAINFKMIEVPVGAVLRFTRDENKTCTVVSNSEVEFEGKMTSLTAAAISLLAPDERTPSRTRGPMHWKYEGELLTERRIRMEEAE